jgi:hypothetical protein
MSKYQSISSECHQLSKRMRSVSTLPQSKAMAPEDHCEQMEMSPRDSPKVGPRMEADCRRVFIKMVEESEHQR